MSNYVWWIPVVLGVVFITLGIGAIIWGKREEKSYYDSLTTRTDLREYFDHWPMRPQPGALKIGGWIALAVGLIMMIIGAAFGLTG